MRVCGSRQQILLWLLLQIRKRYTFISRLHTVVLRKLHAVRALFILLIRMHTHTHTHTRIFLRNIDFFPSSSSWLLMRTSIFVNKSVCLCQSLCSNARSGFVSDSCRLGPGSENHWQLRSLLAFAC